MRVIRTLKLPCRVGEHPGQFQVQIGQPAPGFHPLHFQSEWFAEVRGGEIDPEALRVLAGAVADQDEDSG